MVLTSSRQDLRRWLTEKTGGDKAEPLLDLMARCKNKPFYCGIHPSKVVDCCTWHILIPPKTKADFPSPLYPFQQNIIQDLEQNKRIGIVKARGIGASELFLRYALHLALSKQLNGNFLFVTGVGHVLSTSLARRVKDILKANDVYFDDNQSTISFPHCRWSFHGSDSAAYRGQSDVVWLFADELTQFQEDPMPSIDTYAIKNSGAYIVLVCTPSYKLDHFSYQLFNQIDDSKSLYKRFYLSYFAALDTMLDRKEIEMLKATSLSFPSEYELKWGGGVVGNVFATEVVSAATNHEYSLEASDYQFMLKSGGLDWGSGSSKTALTILAFVPEVNKIRTIYCHQWERPDYSTLFPHIWNILVKYGVQHLYVDGSSPANVLYFMRAYGDDCGTGNYLIRIQYYKDTYKHIDPNYWEKFYHCVPKNFSTSARPMLSSFKLILDNGLFESHKDMPELTVALHSATAADHFSLNKSASLNNDILDSTILAASEFNYRTPVVRQ